MDSADDRVID